MADNPFSDPSIAQATGGGGAQNQPAEFNPFAGVNQPAPTAAVPVSEPQKTIPVPVTYPAAQPGPVEQPPAYTPSNAQATAAAATDDLRRRQEELERKENELRERERQLHSQGYPTKLNNWPPLPEWTRIKPCFYQDFGVDIPAEFQRTVKLGYYLWIVHAVTHVWNLIAAVAYMVVLSSDAGTVLGLSILYVVIFTPCSFICWYRPLYKAFRSDSSFNFFLFFFVQFVQTIIHAIEALGLDTFGTCGWINAIKAVSHGWFSGIIMFVAAALFTGLCVCDCLLLAKVHHIFRGGNTRFSLQSAQTEFATGVMSNQQVRSAAYGAATNAAAAQMANPSAAGTGARY